MSELIQWVSLIRDIGFILGVPVLIGIGMKLYDRQIEILKARNDLLKETQYDRASSLLESQKKVFLIERESLEHKIAELERSGSQKDETLVSLQYKLAEVSERIQNLDRSKNIIDEANFAMSLFANDVSFSAERFEHRVDFSRALFSNEVKFDSARFASRVVFDNADLKNASFVSTDLRGVDLSKAVIDQATKLPKVHYGRYKH